MDVRLILGLTNGLTGKTTKFWFDFRDAMFDLFDRNTVKLVRQLEKEPTVSCSVVARKRIEGEALVLVDAGLNFGSY